MRYILDIDPRFKIQEEVVKTWSLPVYISISGDIDEENAKKFRDNLSMTEDAAYRSGQEIIPITIDTFGGDVYALMGMIDAIKNCALPIATIIEGKAHSAGAFLFSCGTEGYRFMGPNASLMIHSVSAGYFGRVEELKTRTEEVVRVNEKLFEIMSQNCGHHPEYFSRIVKEKQIDWFLTTDEATKHNLANKIHLPTFKVKAELSYKFE